MNGLYTALGVLGLGLVVSACQPSRPPSTDQPSRVVSSPAEQESLADPATPLQSLSPPGISPSASSPTVAPRATITAAPPQAVEPSAEPATTAMELGASPAAPATSSEPVIPSGSTYYQPDGLFEISFPPEYSYRPIEDGVSFISNDRRFGGSANVLSAEGQTLTNELLEQGLKEEYMNRLKAVEWQASTVQADGSLRIDWVGVDTNGDVLDSVSFVEQHGDRIYILNLHAINEAYAKHEDAAVTIVENYRLLWDE